MRAIIGLIKRSTLKDWCYPQMERLADQKIIDFTSDVGGEGTRVRLREVQQIQSANKAHLLGRFMAAIVMGQVIGYIAFYAIAAYVVYWFFTIGGK